jgi:hypothetical protein
MNLNWNEILQSVLNYALPALISFVVLKLLPKLFPATQAGIDWVKNQAANVKNEWARTLLNRVITLVGQKVLAFEQTFIEDMKTKVMQGRIDPKDIPAILKEEKDKLLAQLKAELTVQGLWNDLKVILGGEDGFIIKWLDQVLESQVAQLPPSGLQTRKVADQPAAVEVAVAPPVPQPAAS